MTITFACSCGRQLAAADENAGQRVRCGACGGIQTVPQGEPAPRWVAEPAAMIRFACSDCGQTCQARPEHAGRKTRCPQCDRILTIPGSAGTDGELEEVSSRRSDALQADRPLPRSARRPAFDDDDEPDEDDRPRRRRSIRKKSRKWLWLSLSAAALLLCGGGLALWLLLRTTTSSDFDLVPRDAQGFVTVRVADLVKSPLGKKAMDEFQQELAVPLRELQDKTGLALADIDRVTVVFVDVEHTVFWIIVQTNKSLDRDKILKTAENPPEKTHGGRKYYAKRDLAIAFLHSRLLIFGSEKGIERCLDLPKKPKAGPLDDALRAASKGKVQLVMAGHLSADLAARAKTSLERLEGAKVWVDKFAPLFDIRTAYFTYAVSKDIDWEFVLTFPDSAKAKKGEATLNDVFSTLRLFLPPLVRLGLQQQGITGKEADEAVAQTQRGLEQMKPKQSGNKVSMAGKESGSQFVKQLDTLKKQFKQLPLGGGFGRPPGQGFAPPPRLPGGMPPGPRRFPGGRGRGR